MNYKTFDEIRIKVERELDLEAEEFIQPDEIREYINDAVAEVEAEIHTLGIEDEYFLTKAFLPLVDGTSDYLLPENIYASKIRKITYRFGATIYTIDRIRGPERFEIIERILQYNSVTDYYQYILVNNSATSNVELELYPPSRETSSTNVKIWYIREANRWLDNLDLAGLCDLPEIALQFLYEYVKFRCYEKEGHPNTEMSAQNVIRLKDKMTSTLQVMVPDEDSTIPKDMSSYQDLS